MRKSNLGGDCNKEIFELYDEILGEIDSWEEADGSMHVSETTNYGVKTVEIDSYYYVYIDDVKYFFLVDDKPIYDTDESSKGLWFLLIPFR